jgi:lysophospholipase L1-like esterase
MVKSRAEAGAHIIFVDQFTGFDANSDLQDGVHPTEGGYAKMGTKWYDAIKDYL